MYMDCSKMDKNSWLLTWVLFWAGAFLAVYIELCYIITKRAQRALGRSPEEKVKGHSGTIYRGPQIHVVHQILLEDL